MTTIEIWSWVGLSAAGTIIAYCVGWLTCGWWTRHKHLRAVRGEHNRFGWDGLGKRVDDLAERLDQVVSGLELSRGIVSARIEALEKQIAGAMANVKRLNLSGRVEDLERQMKQPIAEARRSHLQDRVIWLERAWTDLKNLPKPEPAKKKKRKAVRRS